MAIRLLSSESINGALTLTGNLTGTTAGFSGSITASGNSNSFGNTTIGALAASTGTFSASVTAAGNSNSFGTSTFTGNISGVRGFFNSGATNVVATFTSTDGTATLQCADPTGNVEFGASGNNFVVQPAGGVAQLTVGSSSSTFAGDVGIGISPGENLHIFKSDATALIQASNTSGIAQLQFFPRDSSNVAHLQSIKGVDSSLTFLTGGNSANSYVPTERMRISSTGATFTGNITAKVGNFQAPDATASIINQFACADGSNAATFRTTTSGKIFEIRSQNSGTIKIDSTSTTFTGSVTCVGLDSQITGAVAGYFASNTSINANQIVHIRDNVATTSVNSAGGIKISSSPGNDVFLLKRNATTSSFFALQNSSASEFITVNMASGNVGIGVINPTSKLTLPQEEENGFKIEFTGGSYSSGISTVDQAGSGLYIGANSYVNNTGNVIYKDSALDSNGIYFDAWNGNNMKFYTALAGTPQQRMSIAGDGAVVINGTTNLIGKLRVGGTALATSNLHVYSSFGNGGSLWSIGASDTYAYTAHKQWTSFDGAYSTGVFYTIGVIEDSRSAIINVKTAAHSTATLLVSRGYGPSNLSRFQVLSSTKNPNGGYANITDVQISGGGKVDIKLVWNSGPNVAIEVTVYGNGFTIANTLQASTATVGSNYPDNVLWSHSLPSDAGSAMVAGQLRVTGNIVNPGTWGTTTGSAANMHVDSNGTFFRSTSSLKYKKEVRDYDKGLNEVMQLQPKYYKGKDDGDIQFAGLIAEDVHDLGLTEFVQYADDKTPDALAYPNMIALLTKAIQELKAEIELLKSK